MTNINTVVLSFHDDANGCIEWEAVVDTLGPILDIIDDDDEPSVPQFPGCTVFDSSYGSGGGKNAFMIDYGQAAVPIDPQELEATVRQFLADRYGMTVQAFASLPAASSDTSPVDTAPPGCKSK